MMNTAEAEGLAPEDNGQVADAEVASGKNMRKIHTIFGMKWCINGMK